MRVCLRVCGRGYDVGVYVCFALVFVCFHDSAFNVSSHSVDSVDFRAGLFLKIFL